MQHKMIERKIGIFEIDRVTILRNSDLAKHILENMLVVRAESLFYKDAIEYVAYSDLFELIDYNIQTPRYKMEVDENAIVKAVKI